MYAQGEKVMNNSELRIIIIDDNPKIHQDVIKVLAPAMDSDYEQSFVELEERLFDNQSEPKKVDLPNFQFETAQQGQEGLKKIKKAYDENNPFALAFVDVRMPSGWDGMETITNIWKVDSNIQVIICTAFSDYSLEETIDQLGISDNYLILKKPFDSMALRQLAYAMTRKWVLAKEQQKYTENLKKKVFEKSLSLEQSLSLFRATIESSKDALLVFDLNDKIIDYNHCLLQLFNIPNEIIETKEAHLLENYILPKIKNHKNATSTFSLLNDKASMMSKDVAYLKDGRVLECYSQPYLLNNELVGRVWTFHDISEQVHLEQELEYQALHDSLTNLPNRLLLHDRIAEAISLAKRHNNLFGLLFFDLDRFKLINDSFGHNYGDELLKKVAKRLSGLIRKSDTFSRLGGDEFVILIQELTAREDVIKLIQKIVSELKKPFIIAKKQITISISIGISIYPDDGEKVSTLLRKADAAMYLSKGSGGATFNFYTEKLNKETKNKLKIENEIRKGLEKNEFFLMYQPQIHASSQTLLSVEALIRWQHPEKGVILPPDFIPIAEESQLIVELGEWVFREVCRQIVSWKESGLPLIRVAVNVAAQQLKQNNFDETIKSILEEYHVPPEYIDIEIKENVIVTHKDVLRMIEKLKQSNVNVILDDFGTGNSGLNYLKQIQFDQIKIDQSFVSNISKSQSDETIIEAVITMANSMDLKVIAEGVENQEQLDFLTKKGCELIQGFLYSAPIFPEKLAGYFKRKR